MQPEIQIPEADETAKIVAERIGKIAQIVHSRPPQPAAAPAVSREARQRKAELLHAANLPKRHLQTTDFRGDAWKRSLSLITGKIGTGCFYALVGVRGAGKTQMGVEVARFAIERWRSSRFVSAMGIFLLLKESFRKSSENSERTIVENFCKPSLLVIDEIQERAESPWEDRILTHLIDERYQAEKDTILIGNMKPEALTEAVGPSITRRLNETGGVISCDWENFRK